MVELMQRVSDMGFRLYDAAISLWNWLFSEQKIFFDSLSRISQLVNNWFGLNLGIEIIPPIIYRPIDIILWVISGGFVVFLIIKLFIPLD